MSQQSNFSAELLRLCGQMRDQTISHLDAARLNELLATHPQARQFYLRFMAVTAGLETQLNQSDTSKEPTTDTDLLLDLLRMEQDAEVTTIKQPTTEPNVQPSRQKQTTQLNKGLALYITGQALRSKPAQWLAAAAVIALCVLVALQFVGPSNSPAPVANQPQAPSLTDPIARKVATLTAEHDAMWDRRPGDDLYAGQRFELTQGFAEITTQRGAVAILEAPATIELLNNDNALRLHAGKLVGICETPSSKGFLVRTPHMDITDLGTRFGVDANRSDQTRVYVFEGSVQAQIPEISASEFVVMTQQAYSFGEKGVERIAYEDKAFGFGLNADGYRPRFEGLPMVWHGRAAADLREGRQPSPALQVFLEHTNRIAGYGVPIQVSHQTPWPNDQAQEMHIERGTRSDVYLLHFDHPDGRAVLPEDGEFILHFERSIQGVLVDGIKLFGADKRYAAADLIYPTPTDDADRSQELLRGLNRGQAVDQQETAEVFNDGKSLRLRLNSTDDALDQLRVFVDPLPIDP